MIVGRVIVIGGGPAGMIAAYSAALAGAKVVLLERNDKLGKKLYLTGKGRCNVTNSCDKDSFFQNICSGQKFMFSSFRAFDNADLLSLLESAGTKLKVERGNRVFPESDKSSDIIRALVKLVHDAGVKARLNTYVKKLEVNDGKISGVVTSTGRILCDAVIIATGGESYPLTGSDGNGYALARSVGHTVTHRYPSLISLKCADKCCPELMGLSLKNVSLTIFEGEKERFSEQGEMLFTHFGVSGPLVLSASAHIADRTFSDTRIEIDLKPALDEQTLDLRLLREFAQGNSKLITVLYSLYPKALAGQVLARTGTSGEVMTSNVDIALRKKIIALTKHFTLSVKSTMPIEEAIITRGGVELSEVSPSTLMSKKIEGLFFSGEVLNIDAYTGGFNLQIAFSTGFLAGKSAVNSIKQ